MAVDPIPVVGLMGVVFGIHIVLVNIDMGLAVLIPLLKRLGEKWEKPRFVDHARAMMQYLAVIYASAGVFATGFTVFILSFFPDVLWLAGNALVIPYGAATVFVALRLGTISAYWYGWDRFKPNHHFLVGLVLASTSFIVPLFFRVTVAVLNTTNNAIVSFDPILVNIPAALLNPTLWPLYLKSIFGAFAVTFLLLASFYVYRLLKGLGDAEENREFIRFYAKAGGVAYLLNLVFGPLYLVSLWFVARYKFDNMLGPLFGDNSEVPFALVLFGLKTLLLGIQLVAIIYLTWEGVWRDELSFEEKGSKLALLTFGPAAALTIFVGEIMNGVAQYPWAILEPDLVGRFPQINVETTVNDLAAIFDIYAITLFALTPLLLAMLFLFYWVLQLGNEHIDKPKT